MRAANRALAVVSVAVLLASSTWFSGTAAAPALARAWHLSPAASAWLTLSTQVGFIGGTFLYAATNLADVYNPRWVFFGSAVATAACNAAFALVADGLGSAVALRAATGVALAGVYPVGMKIVASWFRTGLGWRLGVMVGALTLGTATPYLLRAVGADLGWRAPVASSSVLAVAGGALMVVAVRDGPHLRDRAPFDPRAMIDVFRDDAFRYTAIGYFGHMWELYAFWSLVGAYVADAGVQAVPLVAFATVGVGALGCAAGGWLSRRVGERAVATWALATSGIACALSGVAHWLPAPVLVAFVLVWGVVVVADSPQFSALAARYCPPRYTGTALTVQNGVGFAVTLVTIQLVPVLAGAVGWRWAFAPLAAGPAVGLWAMARLRAVS
ncbi:MAG: MFS transporter [Deltaproteobacteria bacterium]|nr:MAG: MFS transporter [Deltaproteobacteria bacterium]